MGLLSTVQNIAPRQPSRVVLYAGEGFGKTSWSAFAPKPIFLMSQGETGLLSLLEAGRVPPTDFLPECVRWAQLDDAVGALSKEQHNYRTVVIDTANGAELSLADDVRQNAFGGSQTDFDKYGRGAAQVSIRWGAFLAKLDRLRTDRQMSVILLHHAQVKTFSDPAGKDWDQYQPHSMKQCWQLTHKWSDIILFGGMKTQVSRDDKATSSQRYLRTESAPAIVAKNRYGLPAEIIPSRSGPKAMWDAFADALRAAKANGQTAPAPVQAATPEPVRQPDPEPERQPGQWVTTADTDTYEPAETDPNAGQGGDDLDLQTDDRVEFLVELAGKCEMTTQNLPWAEIFGQDGLTGLNIRELTDDEYDAVYHWLDATYTRLHPRKAAKEKAGTT